MQGAAALILHCHGLAGRCRNHPDQIREISDRRRIDGDDAVLRLQTRTLCAATAHQRGDHRRHRRLLEPEPQAREQHVRLREMAARRRLRNRQNDGVRLTPG
jgi:hypothetical protein